MRLHFLPLMLALALCITMAGQGLPELTGKRRCGQLTALSLDNPWSKKRQQFSTGDQAGMAESRPLRLRSGLHRVLRTLRRMSIEDYARKNRPDWRPAFPEAMRSFR